MSDVQYTRISSETCVVTDCGGQLHSDFHLLSYRCPECHVTYMRIGVRLIPDRSMPQATLITRKDK